MSAVQEPSTTEPMEIDVAVDDRLQNSDVSTRPGSAALANFARPTLTVSTRMMMEIPPTKTRRKP